MKISYLIIITSILTLFIYSCSSDLPLDVVIEQQLDTHVIDFCESACTLILLAGINRTAERDAKIGFHQTSISPADALWTYAIRIL